MKQLLILSGKGGTGKTTFASAFIKLNNSKRYADCDVDTPNLHLLTKQIKGPKIKNFYGLDKAEINVEICTSCDLCRKHCRFDAIFIDKDQNFRVNPYLCEGCAVCEYVCPVKAISLVKSVDGEIKTYVDKDELFATAQLNIGSGMSGLLVTEVKKKILKNKEEIELAIIDGSPGIGCPVIASISGVTLVLIVAEPSMSGFNDLKRIVETANIFQTPIAVVINKYDLNENITKSIKQYCKLNKIPYLGQVPFDEKVNRLVNRGLTIVDQDLKAGLEVKKIYSKVMKLLKGLS